MEKSETKKQDIVKLLAEGRTVEFFPQGYSMYPLFTPGRDSAVVAPLGKEKTVRRGDVVLYRRPNGFLILHRVHHVSKDGVFLLGDNQTEVEGEVARDALIGILQGIRRNNRYIATTNLLYRLYSGLWLILRSARPVISRAVHRLKKNLDK